MNLLMLKINYRYMLKLILLVILAFQVNILYAGIYKNGF